MANLLQTLDAQAVLSANAFTTSNHIARVVVYGIAELLIFLFPLILYLLWKMPELRGRNHAARKAVVIALITTMVAIIAKAAISIVYLRPRPFVTHPELQYFHVGIDPQSFPSGNTMVSFAIATSLYLSGFPKVGGWLLVCSSLIAAARVFAGVHYPTDVLGGAVIGVGLAFYMHREASTLRKYLPNT